MISSESSIIFEWKKIIKIIKTSELANKFQKEKKKKKCINIEILP